MVSRRGAHQQRLKQLVRRRQLVPQGLEEEQRGAEPRVCKRLAHRARRVRAARPLHARVPAGHAFRKGVEGGPGHAEDAQRLGQLRLEAAAAVDFEAAYTKKLFRARRRAVVRGLNPASPPKGQLQCARAQVSARWQERRAPLRARRDAKLLHELELVLQQLAARRAHGAVLRPQQAHLQHRLERRDGAVVWIGRPPEVRGARGGRRVLHAAVCRLHCR